MKKRVLSLVLVVFTLVSMLAVLPAEAAEPELPITEGVYFAMTPPVSFSIPIYGLTKKSQVKSLKSSNKNVASVTVNKYPGDKDVLFTVEPKKPGNATISIKVEYGKKTKTLKYKVTVKKYVNVSTSFKIGSKDVASKFQKEMFASTRNPKKKEKISIKPRKGWELRAIRLSTKSGKQTTIANNKKVNLKKYSQIYVDFDNVKEGFSSTLVVDLQ